MGRRGPRPQSAEEAEAKGNPGKRPLNQDEPQLAEGDLKPPKDVEKRPRALQEWNRLALELHKKGVLTIGDRPMFAQYCKQHADVLEWEELVERIGKQDAVKLGYANQLAKARALFRQTAAEIGLTPTSRRSVRADKSSHRASVEAPRAVPTNDQPVSKKRKYMLGVLRGGRS